MFYAGDSEFVDTCSRFVLDGLEADEPVIVGAVPRKLDMLRDSLGSAAREVHFVDMCRTGRNPARLIPAWLDFLSARASAGVRVRGIGEPIWAGRTSEELVEAQRHEHLVNLAFNDTPAWFICPYDTQSLGQEVLEEAYHSHPYVSVGDSVLASASCLSIDNIASNLDDPLPPPTGAVSSIAVSAGRLAAARHFVAERAANLGMAVDRVQDLKLAVSELAANTVLHGGGEGLLSMWCEGSQVVIEVADRGSFQEPLVGRRRPTINQEGGRGMWIVNQVCDLVQVRATPGGSVVRIRITAFE